MSARTNRPASIRDVKVFLRLSDAIGVRVPGEALRTMVAKYDWRHTFSFFATLAASWANGEEAAVFARNKLMPTAAIPGARHELDRVIGASF